MPYSMNETTSIAHNHAGEVREEVHKDHRWKRQFVTTAAKTFTYQHLDTFLFGPNRSKTTPHCWHS